MSDPENLASEEFKEQFTPTQLLKMTLFTQGIRPTDRARVSIQGDEGNPLTTDESYVSTGGIILREGEFTTINAPFPENNPIFENTPNILDFYDGKLWVIAGNSQPVEVQHVPAAAYVNKHNHSGIRYGDMTATHTDRARVSPIQGCALDCQFCNIPSQFKYKTWEIPDLVESVGEAINDPVRPAQHLLISGGTPGPRHFKYLQDVWEAIAKAHPGLDIDIMMTPSRSRDGTELLNPQWLKDLEIHALSVNMELYDDSDLAKIIMPGKHNIGRNEYLKFLENAVKVFEVGNVRSILMVGLEPIEKTLAAVEELAQRGICPELSPFRPDPTTPLKDQLPPSIEDQMKVYLGTHKILAKYESQYPGLNDGLQCIDCMHNVLVFPGKNSYRPHYDPVAQTTSYEYPFRS